MAKPLAITEVTRLREALEGCDRRASGIHPPASIAAEIRRDFDLIGLRPGCRVNDHLRPAGAVQGRARYPLRGARRVVQDSSA